jgi:hypothetical protein
MQHSLERNAAILRSATFNVLNVVFAEYRKQKLPKVSARVVITINTTSTISILQRTKDQTL